MILSDGSKSGDTVPRSLFSFPLVFRDSPCSRGGELLNVWLCLQAKFFTPNCMTADLNRAS